MVCDICGKRQAAILIQQVRNNETQELSICKHCADRYSLYSDEQQMNISIESVYEKIAAAKQKNNESSDSQDSTLFCPSCGTPLLKVKKNHQIGCPFCFFYFQDTILSIMKEHTDDICYTGEVPTLLESYTDCRISLSDLKTELQHAIEQENYELAAYFRDQINKMEATEK
ncbi:MAG: UvrB/UvrC motif-containing protein [Treponema sp.]